MSHGSPSISEERSGKVVRPDTDAEAASAVEAIDFWDAISDGEADVQAAVRDSRAHQVLEELDENLVGLQRRSSQTTFSGAPSSMTCRTKSPTTSRKSRTKSPTTNQKPR